MTLDSRDINSNRIFTYISITFVAKENFLYIAISLMKAKRDFFNFVPQGGFRKGFLGLV